MKSQLYYLKFLTCTLLILPVIEPVNLHAQDYQISFAGSGGSTTVDSVIIENLTQGTILKMKGSDVLHLKGTVSVFETVGDNETGKITFYPNPMKDYAKMQFVLPEAGETIITLHDLSAREIVQTRDLLSKGDHTYSIQSIKEGIYLASIISGRYSLFGKLVSSGSEGNGIRISHESSTVAQDNKIDSKGMGTESEMQYNTGDRLKLRGKSGVYSTVITDVPEASKTITYNFIACTDGDGNNYPIVQINIAKGTTDNLVAAEEPGTQTWMAENLKTTKFNDNADIPWVIDGILWCQQGEKHLPAYTWYKNSDITYKDTYGALYNWHAVNTGKLCPAGWHVPNDDEWIALVTYLGGWSIAGGKLKETGTSHWESPNTGATNETGFTALPGGGRNDDGGFFDEIGYLGIFWSSLDFYPYTRAHILDILYNSSNAGMNAGIDETSKVRGFSVRCIKDKPAP